MKNRVTPAAVLLCLFAVVAALLVTGATSQAAGTRLRPVVPGPNPVWGANIRVNPPPGPNTDRHANFGLDVDPSNPTHALAGYEVEDNGIPMTGYSFSTDSGNTWGGHWFTGTWGGKLDMTSAGNASVGFNGTGVGFLASAAVSSTLNGMFVLTTTNGADWSPAVPVTVTDFSAVHDQGRIAVDKRTSGANAGSAYLVTRYYTTDYAGVVLFYSRDQGATWSDQVQVSQPADRYAYLPVDKVATNGNVYVAFEEIDNADIHNPPKLYLNRSTDGGVTFGADQLVTGAPISPTGALDLKGRELMLLGGPDNQVFAVTHGPSIAVSPADPNTVYMVWNDGRWDSTFPYFSNTGRHGDIAFSRTTDGGQTWSAPIRVNDDQQGNGIDQWMPTIEVQADGTIGATWYDRRVDPTGYLYDLFYSQSTDGGQTWSPNQRVSNYSSNPIVAPDAKGNGEISDYGSLAFGPDYALPGWVDSRRGSQQDVYTSRGVLASCTISFTDVPADAYFYDGVRYLSCAGAVSGYSDNTFRPYNNTTRGQLAKIVVLAEGFPIDTTGGPHFSDVPQTNPFYQYIETAYNRGLISGYADGTFRWGNNVTRAQLSKIVVLAQGWTLENPPTPTFTDVPPTDPFYQYIETAFRHGIISGYADGTFRPGNDATRGQIGKIVYLAVTSR